MSRLLTTAVTIELMLTTTMRLENLPVDPCSLLAAAQVSAALGVTVEAGKPLGNRACYWRESGGMMAKKASLTILSSQEFAIGKTPLQGTEKPAVSGIGDEAYYKYFAAPRYDKTKAVDLEVKTGATTFGIDVGGFSVEEGKAKAKALALAVIPKL